MNIDSVYFKKKDIVNSREAFNELEKVRLQAKPTKKVLILDPSKIPPDMMNTLETIMHLKMNFGELTININ